MPEVDESRVRLINIAEQLALLGSGGKVSPGQEDAFLGRFRAAYDHLSATVFTSAGPVRRRDKADLPPWK